MLIKCNIAIVCEKKDAVCKCPSMAEQSLEMEARCGSPMEHSWTAVGLACSEVDCLAGVDSNIWPSIEDSGRTSAGAVAWAAASVSFCSTCSAHRSELRGSLMSKTGGLEDPRVLDYNSGVDTWY